MPALAATPFAGLLELFALVPLGLIAAIYGAETASGALRRRGGRPAGARDRPAPFGRIQGALRGRASFPDHPPMP